MTCTDCTPVIVEMARGMPDEAACGEARAHLRTCSRCRARLVQEGRLSSALRTLREHARDATPSAVVEASLRRAFEARREPLHAHEAQSPRQVGTMAWRGLAAAAALVLLVGSLLLWQRQDVARVPPPASDASGTHFVEWPGAASLPAFESGQLVRTELPASVLPLLGITPSRAITTAMVPADVIVGQDGLARAVRLAPISVEAVPPVRETP